jgi:hypothetical protein
MTQALYAHMNKKVEFRLITIKGEKVFFINSRVLQ